MERSESYQVKLEIFQGPLDLLLFLIRKQKIDIHDIPIAVITQQYLEYLNQKESINLDREAEFLLMAALLIYIKSQMLLPREQVLKGEDDDPRQTLVARLLDFQKIKTASVLLRKKEDEEQLRWKRTFLPSSRKEEEFELQEVSLFDLAERFFSLMKRKEKQNVKVIKGKEFSVEEKMKEIIEILSDNSFLDFLDYFNKQKSLEEALISFFSLLELLKARVVIAIQEQLFQSIKVWFAKDYFPEKN